ncbi:MAG: hypothetical protein ABWY14_06990 [Tardiphaga sp.]
MKSQIHGNPVPCGRGVNDLDGEKTASASESLARNLAANATFGEKTVHGGTMRQPGVCRQGWGTAGGLADFGLNRPVTAAWLMIINLFGLRMRGFLLIH